LTGKIRTLDVPTAPDLPAVLHGDVSGVVAEVGKGVATFHVGDAVYWLCRRDQGGALGEYRLADAGQLTPLVDSERFTLAQVNAAHKYFADNKHTGKIVIEHPS